MAIVFKPSWSSGRIAAASRRFALADLETWRTLLLALLAAFLFWAAPALAQEEAAGDLALTDKATDEATLTYFNRPIVTFRATIGGMTPRERAERAHRRLVDLESSLLDQPIELSPIELAGKQGIVISISGRVLFGVAPDDVDPEQISNVQILAEDARSKLAAALAARLEQQKLPVILKGVGYTALSAMVLALSVWLIWRLRVTISAKFHALVSERLEKATAKKFDWTRYGYALTARLVQLATSFAIFLLGYIWLGFSLEQFPVTEPVGERLNGFLVDLVLDLASKATGAIPGIITACVILLVAQALAQVTANVINAAEGGSVSLPFVKPDTAPATRRILRIIIWCVALAIAYPYIPGSDSAAFQGLSVLIGLMITLGSTGIVSQMMSGTVLVYSRALHLGEYVSTGDVEGVVTEMGAISTKLVTVRNEEITIPNAVLVEATIKNYSRRSSGQSALFSTKVTIGYDTPWRQVHAMLLMAAGATQGLLSKPAPYVAQRALTDFYVEYELFVYIGRPLDHVLVMSMLHGKIQDIFNEYGVQIMSPQYYEQPPQPLIVPKDKWYAAPAVKE